MVRYMQVLQPPRNRRAGICSVEHVGAWRWRKLLHLSPHKLSTSAAWQSERPTNNNTKANTQAEQTPRQRMDCYCYHHTSHQQPTVQQKVTRTHISALRPASSWLPLPLHLHPLLLPYYFQLASSRPSPPKQLLAAFHLSLPRCHQPINPFILLDSPLSPTPWVVALRAAGAWGTRWAPTAARHARIVPSVWLSAGPVVQDLACCAALVDASVASSYHVHPSSQVASAARCLATCNFPTSELHAARETSPNAAGFAARLCMRG